MLEEIAKVYNADKATMDIASRMGKELLNTIMAVFNDFGRLGTLDTDNVARVFMGDISGLTAKEYAMGNETFEKLKQAYGINLEQKTMARILKATEGLTGMSTEQARKIVDQRNKLYKNFELLTKYYYDDIKISRMSIVMPMDLGYAHYWGYFGIPIYFPKDSDHVYYVKTHTYYLSFFDQLVYTKSFLDRGGDKLTEKDGTEFQKEIEKKVNNKLIHKAVSEIREVREKLEWYAPKIKKNGDRDDITPAVKQRILKAKSELDDIIQTLKMMEEGQKSDSSEKGLTKSYKEDILDFSVKIIKDYNELVKQNKDDEEIQKAYHFVSNYMGYRIEVVSDLAKKELARFKDNQFLDALEELRATSYEVAYQADQLLMAGLKGDVKPCEAKADKAVARFHKEAENYKKVIPDIEKNIIQKIAEIKKHVNLIKYGMNKAIPHNLKLSDNKDHFRIRNKRTTDWSDKGINETFNETEETKDLNASSEYDMYLNKENNLYLDQVPGKERRLYESYRIHITQTIASALRYAFRILPFYHYDPRRHYAGKADLKALKNKIKENFAFQIFTPGQMEQPMITPITFTDAYFDTLFAQEKTSNESAFALVQNGSNDGICWGFKMYTELGYVPYMYNAADRGYPVMKDSMSESYQHLNNFFAHMSNLPDTDYLPRFTPGYDHRRHSPIYADRKTTAETGRELR